MSKFKPDTPAVANTGGLASTNPVPPDGLKNTADLPPITDTAGAPDSATLGDTMPDTTNKFPQPTAPNPFDPDSLRVTGDADTIGAEKILMRIPVRKPNKQEFVRVNTDPEYRLPCAILELKDEREFYVVAPEAQAILAEDVRYVELLLCQNRQAVVFFWPLPMPSSDGRTNSWHQSAREAASLAEKDWIRMIANMSEGGYSVYRATGAIPEPKWPEKTMSELLELAFKEGKLINSEDHPVVKQLYGA